MFLDGIFVRLDWHLRNSGWMWMRSPLNGHGAVAREDRCKEGELLSNSETLEAK